MSAEPQVRSWLVAALARTSPAAGLEGPAAELWYHATDAERAAVAQLHGQEAARLLYEAGVIRKAGTALDLRPADVDRLDRRTSALRHARYLLGGRWQWDTTLGDVLKTADPTIVADVVRALRGAGFRELDDWRLPEELLDDS
jgi:hypothetical protein